MKLLNYTPHTVNVFTGDKEVDSYASVGVARCRQETEPVGSIGNIPIVETNFGEVEGLPAPQEGVMFIVSRLIRQALPYRSDLVVPNDLIRDATGNIIGCKSLAIN